MVIYLIIYNIKHTFTDSYNILLLQAINFAIKLYYTCL